MHIFNDLWTRYTRLNSAQKIIAINVFFFVVPFLLQTLLFLFNSTSIDFVSYFELSPRFPQWAYAPWTLLSYGFFHGSFGHILWNMLLLYYASTFFFNFFRGPRLVNLYFTGVLAGGIVFLISYALFPVFKGRFPALIGSSAGVMAVLIFCCTYTPQQQVRLLFFNVKLLHVGLALVVFDLIQIPTGNAGGHLAHLGGASIGYFSARALLHAKYDVVIQFTALWQNLSSYFKPAPLAKVYSSKKSFSKRSQKKPVDDQKRIDAILDKISASGYDSLTKEEKAFLFKAGKK